MEILQPEEWAKPRGYVSGIKANGSIVALAGQVGWNENQVFETGMIAEQVAAALKRVARLLKEAGGGPEHIVRLDLFMTDRDAYFAEGKAIGAAFRAALGDHYPPITAVEVGRLMVDEAKVEIEALAVIPD
ncbi:MAG: RidA family protein [Hyphomicrobiales bacterium]|nr:RidA family protein [Hyphomicrobiales bacterium]